MLTKLISIGVAVNDIEAAIARYQENFGATVIHEPADQPAVGVRFAIVRVGDADIEFFSPMPGETVLRGWLDTHGEGLYRLAYAAGDFDATLADMDSKRLRYMKVDIDNDLASRVAFLSPKAGNGVMFELVDERR